MHTLTYRATDGAANSCADQTNRYLRAGRHLGCGYVDTCRLVYVHDDALAFHLGEAQAD